MDTICPKCRYGLLIHTVNSPLNISGRTAYECSECSAVVVYPRYDTKNEHGVIINDGIKPRSPFDFILAEVEFPPLEEYPRKQSNTTL